MDALQFNQKIAKFSKHGQKWYRTVPSLGKFPENLESVEI